MPFVTEEIWEKMTGKPGTLIVAAYPQDDEAFRDDPAERIVEALRALVTRVRNFRTERGFSPTEPVALAVDPDSPAKGSRRRGRIARPSAPASREALGPDVRRAGPGDGRDVTAGLSIGLSAPRGAAPGDEERIGRTLAALDGEIAELSAKLQNTAFLDKAPPAVVEKTRKRLVELEERRSALSTGGA